MEIQYGKPSSRGVRFVELARPRVFPVASPARLAGPRLWHAPLAIEAATRGQGIALANELIVREELAAGELVEVMRTAVALEPYVFATRADRWNQPHIARFRRWLVQNFDGATSTPKAPTKTASKVRVPG